MLGLIQQMSIAHVHSHYLCNPVDDRVSGAMFDQRTVERTFGMRQLKP